LGELLKRAATSPAYNASHDSLRRLIEQIRSVSPALAEQAEQELLREVRVAPTLVKYADPSSYEIESRRELRQAAAELMGNTPIATAPVVDLLDQDSLEIELATTLLYEHGHYPYRQIREALRSAGAKRRQEIIDLGLRHRGKHDEMPRAFCAGQQFRFDILMDIGGFRDMHRHRRCIQIGQEFTTKHGYETSEELEPAGALPGYDTTMREVAKAVEELSKRASPESAEIAQYAIPLAFRKRTLFKMDFAEVVYISELRTKVPGHMSYRKVSYAMFEAIARRHPELKQYFRVTDVNKPVDLLDR
jgi:thymidylate synthase ThyX